MKNYFLFFILTVFCTHSKAQKTIHDPNAPVMTFDTTTLNFGDVTQGMRVEKDFRFKNTGKSPLIISEVKGSGATVATYPKEPIPPGKYGIVRVIFPTDGKLGAQNKTSVIQSNNRDGTIVLHIKGNILPDTSAVMSFDSLTMNFGTVTQGTLITKEFHFTNTGKSTLVIQNTTASDGGGSAECAKKTFAPGESGIIIMKQMTSGRMGMLDKTATITSNSKNGSIVLHLRGTVILP